MRLLGNSHFEQASVLRLSLGVAVGAGLPGLWLVACCLPTGFLVARQSFCGCCVLRAGRVGASSLRSPNRPPPSPAHPAIPGTANAALRVGSETRMRLPSRFFAASFDRFVPFSM